MSIQKDLLIELLKKQWTSNYEAQKYIKSSSADRVIRRIRANPPDGYIVIQRKKDLTDKYNRCLEYRLVRGNANHWIFEKINKILYGEKK